MRVVPVDVSCVTPVGVSEAGVSSTGSAGVGAGVIGAVPMDAVGSSSPVESRMAARAGAWRRDTRTSWGEPSSTSGTEAPVCSTPSSQTVSTRRGAGSPAASIVTRYGESPMT